MYKNIFSWSYVYIYIYIEVIEALSTHDAPLTSADDETLGDSYNLFKYST